VSADRGYIPTRIVDAPGLLFHIITLAQENNIMSVLPCAFYRLLQSLVNLSPHRASEHTSHNRSLDRITCSKRSQETTEL
jgi:hypothetical protein